MKIHVSHVSEEDGLEIHHLFADQNPGLQSPDCRIVGRPSIDAFASRSGSELNLQGSVTAQVEIPCARCLEPVPVSVDESFDLSYIPSADPKLLVEERELVEQDLQVAVYKDDCIDLGDVVREQIELSLPMARLCDEECRGLCPTCGANLNEQQCSCGDQIADPRWAALQQLKSESN
jgi:uncharacterized protein